ncbi:MAG TPA: hypothetical protein ENL24_02535 [candidate division Zixibacteria bacterium]|nr:hypothetical protein [candidate division Zixibacteria bacterium]
MKRRVEPLPATELTSLVDIIFQLMIFFLVSISILPAIKSAPQVEGLMNLPTPKRGDAEASVLIQIHKTPTGRLDYYVLQGNDESAEFYNWFKDKRQIVKIPSAYVAFRNAAQRYRVIYDERGLKAFLLDIRDNDPAVIIRAPGNIPYSDVVRITGFMHSIGIAKIAWVRGTLSDLKVEIKKSRRGRV